MYLAVPTEPTAPLRSLLAAGVLLLAALLLAPAPAGASHPPAGATWSEEQLQSSDGTTLDADVFRPAGIAAGQRTPVMLVVSPYHGLPSSSDPGRPRGLERDRRIYELAIARGYTVAQVSLRGTGASHG